MFSDARKLLEMIKFSHTVFALPFALMSATLAWQYVPFRFSVLIGILLCLVFARSAAMTFNRIVDRGFDAQNPRTSMRHLPAGSLSVAFAWIFLLACSVGFVASTLVFLANDNPWPLYLSIPVLGVLFGYSYSKRFTSFAHVWLGVSLMLAPISAWIAIRGLVDLLQPTIIGAAVLFWVAGFDIIYACQDYQFDRAFGLKSIPARIGVRNALRVSAGCHLAMLVALVCLKSASPYLGTVFLCGVAAVAVLLVYEHSLVSVNNLDRVNQAFFLVNGVISIGLLAMLWIDLAFKA